MKYTHFPRQVFDRDKHTDITELIHPLTSSEDKMEYKLIKKFLPELQVFDADKAMYSDRSVVDAQYLEEELAKAKVWKDNDIGENFLALKESKPSKPVSREEIQKALSESAPEYQLEDLLKRILENGVK